MITKEGEEMQKKRRFSLLKRCQRCGASSKAFTMSMMNTEMICLNCKKAEKKPSPLQRGG